MSTRESPAENPGADAVLPFDVATAADARGRVSTDGAPAGFGGVGGGFSAAVALRAMAALSRVADGALEGLVPRG